MFNFAIENKETNNMKRIIITFVLAVSILTACQNAITSTQEEEMSEDSPITMAIDTYIHDCLACNDPYDAYIPVCNIVDTEEAGDSLKVWGDFWTYYYKDDGTSLELMSFMNCSGLIYLSQLPDSTYKVVRFVSVAGGADKETYARRIFGEHYEKFYEMVSDPSYIESHLPQSIIKTKKLQRLKPKDNK